MKVGRFILLSFLQISSHSPVFIVSSTCQGTLLHLPEHHQLTVCHYPTVGSWYARNLSKAARFVSSSPFHHFTAPLLGSAAWAVALKFLTCTQDWKSIVPSKKQQTAALCGLPFCMFFFSLDFLFLLRIFFSFELWNLNQATPQNRKNMILRNVWAKNFL